MPEVTPEQVIAFWKEAGTARWFKKDSAFDEEIRTRFLATHEAAAAGKLTAWEKSATGALAMMLLLDQFPRNMFRDSGRAFATDPQALALAKRAIGRGFDVLVEPQMRAFFYLPFMHAEDLTEQNRGITLYRTAGDTDGEKWAQMHADIIRKFGRFPHRNTVLGRDTTPDERAFLDGGGFSG